MAKDLTDLILEHGGDAVRDTIMAIVEANRPFKIVVTTARELCAKPDPEGPPELLGPLIVRGYRTILAGHAGEGKSFLAFQIARAVSQGEEFLSWSGTGNKKVLVLDLEQAERTAKRRLREAQLDQSELVDVSLIPGGLMLDREDLHFDELNRVLREGQYDLVVVDSTYRLHASDSNEEQPVVSLLKLLDVLRNRHGFALLLLVHCRKPLPGAKFSIHDIFGSSAFERWPETVVGIEKVADGYSRFHWFKDRDGDLPSGQAWGLLFSHEHGFRRDPEDEKDEPRAADKVMAALREASPVAMSYANLEAEGCGSDKTIRRAVAQLVKTKLVYLHATENRTKFWGVVDESQESL